MALRQGQGEAATCRIGGGEEWPPLSRQIGLGVGSGLSVLIHRIKSLWGLLKVVFICLTLKFA